MLFDSGYAKSYTAQYAACNFMMFAFLFLNLKFILVQNYYLGN